MLYAEIILPLALDRLYHYRIDDSSNTNQRIPQVGSRVVVSFGTKRFYTGIIRTLSSIPPEDISPSSLKPIETILEETPLINQEMFELWEWVADYYHCSLGQVMRTALPGGILPESQTIVRLMPDWVAKTTLTEREVALLDTLAQASGQTLTLAQLANSLDFSLARTFDRLYTLGAVSTEEIVVNRYKPKMRAYIGLGEPYQSAEGLALAERLLSRAHKQHLLLGEWLRGGEDKGIDLSGLIARDELSHGEASRLTLIRALIERGIFRLEMQSVSRLDSEGGDEIAEPQPQSFPAPIPLEKPVSLLYTRSSHRREQEILAQVAHYISQGKQVLLLSPSASSFPSQQTFLHQLDQASGGSLYHYHPLTSEAKRTELFLRLTTDDSPCLVLGTRQAIFLPLRNLGLIIVDEEQEYLYKQQHALPLFHSRDVALWIGSRRKIPVLLASETPSAEALFNIFRGKYALLVSAQEEVQRAIAVDIRTVNLSEEKRTGRMPYGTSISLALKEAIAHTLHEGKRVLILQNRRGYAPYALCDACGERITCPRCSVSLTYHQQKRRLVCHYCSLEDVLPSKCPHCGVVHVTYGKRQVPALRLVGYGVERIEEELGNLFPETGIIRIDSESLQSNKRIQELQQSIQHTESGIIVGTQLIKGQPIWQNTGLIAVVQLEAILGFPDFRAEERTYQLLMQLMMKTSEYARDHTNEMVQLILQTNNPEHPFIASLRRRDYKGFINEQLTERHLLRFAPFWRMTYIRLRSTNEQLVEEVAQELQTILLSLLGEEHISAVQTPSVARIDTYYIREIVCRRSYAQPYPSERAIWRQAIERLHQTNISASKVKIVFDVDPL